MTESEKIQAIMLCTKEKSIEIAEAQRQAIVDWHREFLDSQEELPIEFQQILADNIWELYLE